jgi:hypothetical protein
MVNLDRSSFRAEAHSTSLYTCVFVHDPAHTLCRKNPARNEAKGRR